MSFQDADTGAGFGVKGTSTTATGVGVVGESAHPDGNGVVGKTPGPGNGASGVYGEATKANVATGALPGVVSSGVRGVHLGNGRGVFGQSELGNGVVGSCSFKGSGPGFGTSGLGGDFSRTGWGVVGYGGDAIGGTYGSARRGHGVLGITESSLASGVQGANRGGGVGVHGVAEPGTENTPKAERGIGVQGEGDIGVWGESKTASGFGVYGRAFGDRRTNRADGCIGVIGKSSEWGVVGRTIGFDRAGVTGLAEEVRGLGVFGIASKQGGRGVEGVAHAAGGHGVLGIASDRAGIGVVGVGPVRAGMFFGDVDIAGTLLKAVDLFHIDHPQDPANKYLDHAAVESSEMKNIYDGVAVVDRSGRARVRLPRWFEALNIRFRYQLTSIGGPAPELHVAKEIQRGEFWIAGARPRSKVSWQVTGTRNDAWAKAHPLVVERRKTGADRGRYRHPEVHGKPASRGIAWHHLASPDEREAALRKAVDYRSESQPAARNGARRSRARKRK